MKLKKVGKKIGGATCSPTGSARASMTSVNSRAEFAAGHKAGGASRAQRSDRAPLNAVGSLKEEYKAGQKGSGTHYKKLLKIVGAGGLAILMCAGVLCGTLISPMNSTHATTSGSEENFLTPQEQAKAELDANILAGGGLGLDPQNDPVVATTDWGLDIKFHNAGEYSGAGYLVSNPSTNGTVSTAALSGYLYFQGGTYNGVSNLKWVIIGYSTNAITSTGPVKATNLGIPDSSPAGTAAKADSSKGTLISTQYKLNAFTNAVGNAEIPAGCVLCISEKNLLNAYYNHNYNTKDSSGYYYGARWSLSELRTTMSNLCNSGITGFDTIRAKIQTVSLNQYYYRTSDGFSGAIAKDTSSDKFFALANSTYDRDDEVIYNPSTYPQNYRIETYLGYYSDNKGAKRISYTHNTTTADYWWLRSSLSSDYSGAHCVNTSGYVNGGYVSGSLGVRPAFVLKL